MKEKIHFIGIGGIGMSGLAEYMARQGLTVTGSDAVSTEITERLKQFGIEIFIGHNENNVPADADLVVHTAAVKEDNPEYMKAKALGKNIIKRAEMLGRIVNDKFLIAVSGTHGKTTTTAMISKILLETGFDPTVFAGGSIDFLEGGSSKIGESNIAVVEADEYDRSFLQLKPDVIVITNMEHDHSDIYENIEEIREAFANFINNAKDGAVIIACGDEDNTRIVLKDYKKGNKIFYGFDIDNDLVIYNIKYKDTIQYNLELQKINISVPGNHNIANSTAAFIAVRETANVTGREVKTEDVLAGLKAFGGVKRRFELKYSNGVKVYDDYAHHPTEVKATLEAAKKISQGRIIAVFQPHLFSRTKDFYREFADAFQAGADVLFVNKIYPARELPIEGITGKLISDIFNNSGKKSFYHEDKNELLNAVKNEVKEGDTVIFIGAGNITDYCTEFAGGLQHE